MFQIVGSLITVASFAKRRAVCMLAGRTDTFSFVNVHCMEEARGIPTQPQIANVRKKSSGTVMHTRPR